MGYYSNNIGRVKVLVIGLRGKEAYGNAGLDSGGQAVRQMPDHLCVYDPTGRSYTPCFLDCT